MINEVVGVNGYGSPQGTSSTAFVIRGIGDGAPNISLDPAAGRYIDGVYLGKNQVAHPTWLILRESKSSKVLRERFQVVTRRQALSTTSLKHRLKSSTCPSRRYW